MRKLQKKIQATNGQICAKLVYKIWCMLFMHYCVNTLSALGYCVSCTLYLCQLIWVFCSMYTGWVKKVSLTIFAITLSTVSQFL